jgi:hypothetical protein
MPVIFERWCGQAMAKSLELQFPKGVLLKCNASGFPPLAAYRLARDATLRKPFSRSMKSILAADEIRLQQNGCSLCRAINNGVGAMTFILRFIYREYCRSCFLHIRYL